MLDLLGSGCYGARGADDADGVDGRVRGKLVVRDDRQRGSECAIRDRRWRRRRPSRARRDAVRGPRRARPRRAAPRRAPRRGPGRARASSPSGVWTIESTTSSSTVGSSVIACERAVRRRASARRSGVRGPGARTRRAARDRCVRRALSPIVSMIVPRSRIETPSRSSVLSTRCTSPTRELVGDDLLDRRRRWRSFSASSRARVSWRVSSSSAWRRIVSVRWVTITDVGSTTV